jgi:DNA polymerase-3 subunit delta'
MVSQTEERSLDLIDAHAQLWERMRYGLEHKKIPQSLLWVGTGPTQVLSFAYRFMAYLLCQETTKPCGQCQACRMVKQNTHPDIHEITQDPPGSAIKIDQVRALQVDVYQKPQCSNYRFVLIHPADQLNRPAANALLKILEEPPSHTIFILIADQLDAFSPTIKSRCQCTIFPSAEASSRLTQPDYLSLGESYPTTSARRVLFEQRDLMIEQWCDLLSGKIDVCRLASDWSMHALEDMLWFLYLVTATFILQSLMPNAQSHEHVVRWIHLQHQRGRHSLHLFSQLDRIQEFMKTNNQNIPLNQTLVLETLLLGYL